MKLPFKNPKPVVWAIVLFLCAFFYAVYSEAKEQTFLEIGGGVLSGEYSDSTAIAVTERFKGKYDLGFILISDQTCYCSKGPSPMSSYFITYAQRITTFKNWEFGIGLAHASETNRVIGQERMFTLSLYRNIGNWSIRWRHFSNAGTHERNTGQDVISVGYRF